MPLNVPKTLVRRINRKSVTLTDGKRIKFMSIINNFQYWLLLR